MTERPDRTLFAARKRRPSITVQLSDRVVELEAMLRRILDAEWMVTCDWTDPAKREALLAEARGVLGDGTPSEDTE